MTFLFSRLPWRPEVRSHGGSGAAAECRWTSRAPRPLPLPPGWEGLGSSASSHLTSLYIAPVGWGEGPHYCPPGMETRVPDLAFSNTVQGGGHWFGTPLQPKGAEVRAPLFPFC